MTRLVVVAVAAAAAAAVACNGKHGAGFAATGSGSGGGGGSGRGAVHGHGPESDLPKLTGWEPTCAKAFEVARAAAPFERFAILARGCPVCGVDWDPILKAGVVDQYGTTAAHTPDVDAVVKACGGACSTTARDKFIAAFDLVKDEATLDRPWRQLVKDCKGIVWPAPSDRFASAAWYILSAIGRAAPKLGISAPIDLPLPAAMVTGGGLQLAHATSVLPVVPARQIMVMAADVRIAPAPVVTVGPDGLTLNVADNFPGAAVALAAIDAELAATKGDKVALLAPIKQPAIRVLEVMGAIKTEVELHLAGIVPGTGGGWPDLPGMIAPAVTTTVAPGDHVVLAVGGGDGVRVGTVTGGAVHDACTDRDAVRALNHARPAADTKVVIAIEAGAVVEDLAHAIDAAGQAHLPSVALVSSDTVKWPSDLAPCPQ